MKNNEKGMNIIIIILAFLIVVLLICLCFMFYRYEKLEDRYFDLLESKPVVSDTIPDRISKEETTDEIKTTVSSEKTTTSVKYITRDKALEVALNDMKLSKNNVYDVDVEFETKTNHGSNVYEVSFDYNNYEYEYYIDATTGKILSSYKS